MAEESQLFNQLLMQLQQYKDNELTEPRTQAIPESPKIASTDKSMQAFLDTFEEWADLYRRLA